MDKRMPWSEWKAAIRRMFLGPRKDNPEAITFTPLEIMLTINAVTNKALDARELAESHPDKFQRQLFTEKADQLDVIRAKLIHYPFFKQEAKG